MPVGYLRDNPFRQSREGIDILGRKIVTFSGNQPYFQETVPLSGNHACMPDAA
jgi:hypothetical protein